MKKEQVKVGISWQRRDTGKRKIVHPLLVGRAGSPQLRARLVNSFRCENQFFDPYLDAIHHADHYGNLNQIS